MNQSWCDPTSTPSKFTEAEFLCEIVLESKVYLVFQVLSGHGRIQGLHRETVIIINDRKYTFKDSLDLGPTKPGSSDHEYQLFVQPA